MCIYHSSLYLDASDHLTGSDIKCRENPFSTACVSLDNTVDRKKIANLILAPSSETFIPGEQSLVDG